MMFFSRKVFTIFYLLYCQTSRRRILQLLKSLLIFFLIDLTLVHRTTVETSGQSCVYNNEAHNIKYFVNIQSRIILLEKLRHLPSLFYNI